MRIRTGGGGGSWLFGSNPAGMPIIHDPTNKMWKNMESSRHFRNSLV